MRTKTGKILLRVLIALALITVPALVVWAVAPPDKPTVDGKLDPDNEYNDPNGEDYNPNNHPGTELRGTFGFLYTRHIPNNQAEPGFYMCNDWSDPCESYDPNDPNNCDGYNIFVWTQANTTINWRLRVYGNGTIYIEKQANLYSEWYEVDPNTPGFVSAAGYDTSRNDPDTRHPIWELLIPNVCLGPYNPVYTSDPKSEPVDAGDPNCIINWSPPDYGNAPEATGPASPSGGSSSSSSSSSSGC